MSRDPSRETIASAFLERAKEAAVQDDPEQARAWLEGVVELDGNNVEAWLRLANLIPDAQERLQCYARVLELSPGNAQAKAGIRREARRGRR